MIVTFDVSSTDNVIHMLKVFTLLDSDDSIEEAEIEAFLLTRKQLLDLKSTIDEYVSKLPSGDGTCRNPHPHIPHTFCEREAGHTTGNHYGKQYGQYDRSAW